MAFSKPTTKSIYEKAAEFKVFANPSMKKAFLIEQTTARLRPLTLTFFNGENATFSDAFVSYKKQLACYRMESWNSFYYSKLVEVMAGKENIDESDRPSFQRLFNFPDEEHLTCLKTLLQGDLTERTIAAVMAIHYFKPLIPNGSYLIDKSYQKATTHTKCEPCKQDINYGDTTIGNAKLWHGRVDIILKRNIVKVGLEEDLSKLELSDDENQEKDTDYMERQFAIIEVNFMKNIKKQQMKSQFIAESIVNAFYVSKRESNYNQFIPSFFVTEKYIRIIFYNVELDILLKSTKLPIWLIEDEGSLDCMTLIRVWLTLNYASQLDKLKDRYELFLNHIEKAGFKEIAGDAYSEYLYHIDQPLKSTRNKPWKNNILLTKAEVKSLKEFKRYDLEEERAIFDSTSKIIE